MACSLCVLVREMNSANDDLSFKMVQTNGDDEVLARAGSLLVGRAAFETARRLLPRDVIEYRKGARDRAKRGEK